MQRLKSVAITLAAVIALLVITSTARAGDPTLANVWVGTTAGSCSYSSTPVAFSAATACGPSFQSAYNTMKPHAVDRPVARVHTTSAGVNLGTQNLTGSLTTGWVFISNDGNGPVSIAHSTFSGRGRVSFSSNSTLSVAGLSMVTSTKDYSLAAMNFTAPLVIDGPTNAAITISNSKFNNIMTCSACTPARIHLSYGSSQPSGVTIQNSEFKGGNADGIQTGLAVNIINNEFSDIQETGPSDPAHSDSIQLFSGAGSVVRGNFIHDGTDGIVAYDGTADLVVERNVVTTDGRPSAIELYSDANSIVRHNTVDGLIEVNHKSADPAGHGTQIYDNVSDGVAVNGGSTVARNDHNFTGGQFVGPLNTYDGWHLAAGSPGKGAASDGTDAGI